MAVFMVKSKLIDLRSLCFALLCLLEPLNWLLSERQRTGECKEEGEGDKERGRGEEAVKAKETKGRRDRSEAKSSVEMRRRNSLSQMEGSTPGLLPYEGKVLCDEAESCCLCSSDRLYYRNLDRVEKTTWQLVPTSRKLFNIVSMITQ